MSIPPIAGISLFCEDVREESQGTMSLVGVMPDFIQASAIPAVLPNLTVYTRINFDPTIDPGKVEVIIRTPDNVDIANNDVSREIILKAIGDTQKKGGVLAGIISRIGMANLPIASEGRVLAIMRTGGVETVTGALNISLAPPNAAAPPTAFVPPSEQSALDAPAS